jgi:hypothetical protein
MIKIESKYKSNEMPSWIARVHRPSGLIKMKEVKALLRESTLIKVEDVS